MNKPKKDSYASSEELAWFKIENYSGVRGQKTADFADSASSALTYTQWATMLRDRVELARFLQAGETEFAAAQFEKLKTDPLTHLGFSQSYRGGAHAANTPTVKALTANRVRWLNEAMLSAAANERVIVDVQLASDSESVFGDYAHVMVNLRATDKQIRDDFAKWLSTWRSSTPKVTEGDYQNKISRWAQTRFFPYVDLDLFSRITGRRIPSLRRMAMIFPHHTEIQRDPLRRKLSDTYELVFTDDMAKIVAHLAESEATQIPGEIAG
jgi:hypothetical protein